MRSNLKHQAGLRREAFDVEACPYGLGLDPARAMKRWEEISHGVSDETAKLVGEYEEKYLAKMLLMHALWEPLDVYFVEHKTAMLRRLDDFMSCDKTQVDLNYILKIGFCETMLAYTLKWVLESLDALPEEPSNPEVIEFLANWNSLRTEFNTPALREKILAFLFRKGLKEKPQAYAETSFMQEVFLRVLRQAYEDDIAQGTFSSDVLNNPGDLAEWCTETYSQSDNLDSSQLMAFIDNQSQSFLLLAAMVGSVAEALQAEPEFQALSDKDKMKMFRSIKPEFMIEARHWSKVFLNHEVDTGLKHTLVFIPAAGIIKDGYLRFDFGQKRIFIDGEKMAESPIEENDLLIHRGCPVAYVKGKDLGGNFLARQIDFALEVFAQHYLNLRPSEAIETIWTVNETAPLDEDLFEVLVRLNALPFFSSATSCSGHLTEAEFLVGNAPEGQYFCQDGHLWFEVNNAPEAKDFIDEVKVLITRYHNQVAIELESKQEGEYIMHFLYQGNEAETQPLIPMAKPLFVIDKDLGEARLKSFQSFWAELVSLALKYGATNEAEIQACKVGLSEAMEGVPRPALDKRLRRVGL